MNVIWNQWRASKMSADDCEKDLVRCRDRTAPSALEALDKLRKRTRQLDLQDEIASVQRMLEVRQKRFKAHDKVEEFVQQFGQSKYGVSCRFKTLVLVGGTQQGKTSKAMSLWGLAHTLKVSCGSCGEGVMPSLGSFDRDKHSAIVFDEIRPDQVLKHRELFQSNAYEQRLGSSPCNPYEYSVWCYMTPMILCANSWCMNEDKIGPANANWLVGNCLVAELPKDEKWYLSNGEVE